MSNQAEERQPEDRRHPDEPASDPSRVARRSYVAPQLTKHGSIPAQTTTPITADETSEL